MSHVFSDTESDDDDLLSVDLLSEARKRAAPVRDQVPRARRSRSAAAPFLALRPSVRNSGQTGPILSKLPSTCRLLMRALHDDLVDFVRTSTAPGGQSYTRAASIGLAVERLLRPAYQHPEGSAWFGFVSPGSVSVRCPLHQVSSALKKALECGGWWHRNRISLAISEFQKEFIYELLKG